MTIDYDLLALLSGPIGRTFLPLRRASEGRSQSPVSAGDLLAGTSAAQFALLLSCSSCALFRRRAAVLPVLFFLRRSSCGRLLGPPCSSCGRGLLRVVLFLRAGLLAGRALFPGRFLAGGSHGHPSFGERLPVFRRSPRRSGHRPVHRARRRRDRPAPRAASLRAGNRPAPSTRAEAWLGRHHVGPEPTYAELRKCMLARDPDRLGSRCRGPSSASRASSRLRWSRRGPSAHRPGSNPPPPATDPSCSIAKLTVGSRF